MSGFGNLFGEPDPPEGPPPAPDARLAFEVRVERTTADAVLVVEETTRRKAWLPLSKIEFEETAPGRARIVVPGWLAMEKELA